MTDQAPDPKARLQRANRSWWNRNPMSYDWHGTLGAPEGSKEFFEHIDRRFFESSPFYAGDRPFERLIPFDELVGRRVLEVGCGMGSHARLLCEAGAELTAIDLTPKGVEQTSTRLNVSGLAADVRIMDAEDMAFPDDTFDFVWSWGVIHHSADPAAILREMFRVLKPGGEVRLMVYHRHAFFSWYCLARGLLSGRVFRGMSAARIISHYSDGHIARSYSSREFEAFVGQGGFVDVATSIVGQTAELYPLPGRGALGSLKRRLVAATPDAVATALLSRFGYFLCASGRKPATSSSSDR